VIKKNQSVKRGLKDFEGFTLRVREFLEKRDKP